VTDFDFNDRNKFENARTNKRDVLSKFDKKDIDPTKLEIIDCLLSKNIPIHGIKMMHNYVNKNYDTVSKLEKIIESRLPEKYQEFLNFAYFLNKEQLELLFSANECLDMPSKQISYVDLHGLSELYNLKLYENTGKGELLLFWLIKGCGLLKSSKKGDLSHNNLSYEVKAEGGRLHVSSFGDGQLVAETWLDNMIRNVFIPIDLFNNYTNVASLEKAKNTKKWNLGGEDYCRHYYFALKNSGREDWEKISDKFFEAIISGWKKLFTNWKEAQLDFSFVKRYYEEESTKNYHLALLFTNIKSYMQYQSAEGIFFCNEKNNKALYLHRSYFDEMTEEKITFLEENFKYSLPGFSVNVARGNVFSITYKG